MSPSPKKILVAPLDWGLGHTTRCLPLIDLLLQEGHEVLLAAEGVSARILQEQFPQLPLIPIKGYRIQYSHNARYFMPKILSQVPKILSRIRYEQQWLRRQQHIHHFDAVISDNRYGLYHPSCHTTIMTHQVQIMSGRGARADRMLLSLHRKMLERFEECWIVDREQDGLSGALGHPERIPQNAHYIGTLSQLMRQPALPIEEAHCLVLLSGPEPMRSQLEAILWAQCCALPQYRFIFIAGNPQAAKEHKACPPHITYHSYLGGAALFEAIAAARVVICRSGYSTLMDLDWLQKPAVLIPTPGQTEQEYLARYWSDKGKAIYSPQQEIQLASALERLYQRGQASADQRPALSLAEVLQTLSQRLHSWLVK